MKINVAGHSTYLYNGGKHPEPEAIPAQPVVVFIHGAEQDHSAWTLQSRWFGHHGFSVLAPDLPGHGQSAGTPLPSIEAIADWIATLLDTLKVDQAHIVGHSMGSLVTAEFALRHPQRVASVALVGISLPMPVAPVLLDAARNDEPAAREMVNNWSYSPGGQFGGNRVPGLWLLGVNQQLMARQKPGVFHNDLNACNEWRREFSTLGAISAPALVVIGTQDKMTSPKAGKAVHAAIPGAKLVAIPGSGHALMAERPDEVLDALKTFIAKA
ncbi:alpha/beta hydrolase [Betaproteobacteria bacterium]|nr:alpha/beta hydrolase [Betaproteobacteria bacterium]GHU20943.1 alpha/beta hydrolase [Betaproteobacteria bacterium]